MTHGRERYLTDIINKKLRFAAVVALQGARQTGKSFLARNLLSQKHRKLKYVTLDRAADREFALSNPDSFLMQYADSSPLVIDEAQKAAALFDAIKLAVDENKKRGQFLLLGSTEFSKLHRIRESLTGRISRAKLFPFILTESLHKPLSKSHSPFRLLSQAVIERRELFRYLERGGLPGIFAVHDVTEREHLIQDWISLTVERDVHTFPRIKADSDLALKILEGIAILEHPDLPTLTKYCKKSARVVAKHIEILKTLFVIEQLNPHPLGTGKPIYFLCDVAIARALGARFEKLLYTWTFIELSAKKSYLDDYSSKYSYYRTSKGSTVHFIEEAAGRISALKLLFEERFSSQDLYTLRSLSQKSSKIRLFALGAARHSLKDEKVEVLPWEGMA